MELKIKPLERAKKRLGIKSIKKGYHSWFYVVEYGGKEYELKMFDFQKQTENERDSVDCLIEKLADGSAIVKQDIAPLIAERYKVGNVYRFNVRRDEKRPYLYSVVSPESFRFYLDNPLGKGYADRSDIIGRIKSIDDIKVVVEEAELPKEGSGTIGRHVEPETIRQIAEGVGVGPAVIKWAVKAVRANDDFVETRALLAAKSADWLAEAVRVIREKMPWWVANIGKRGHQVKILRCLRSTGIEILEQSNLASGSTADAMTLRDEISACVNKADEYASALTKMQDGSISQYAQSAINSLARTGYIYEPTHRLNVITSAMSIDRRLIGQWTPSLLGAISSRSDSDWRREPLRLALLNMLGSYVSISAPDTDRVIDIKLGNNKALVTDVLRALVIILLLTTDEDDVNRRRLMAMMCRYSSLFGVSDTTRQMLNNKAYGFLMTKAPSSMPFSWSDLKGSADVLSVKTGAAPYLAGPDETMRYDGRHTTIEIKGDDITIRPASGTGRMRDILPAGLTGWSNFHIELHDKDFACDVKGDTDDIDALRRMWREIEDNLFEAKAPSATPQAPQAKASNKPEAGDEVLIRITGRIGKDQRGNPVFRAVIANDNLEGEGTITPRDIVHYNVKYAQESDFADQEGRPFLLKAKVVRELPNGKFEFSMQELVAQFICQTVQEGDEDICRMTIPTSSGDYLLISERGFSLKVAQDDDVPELINGDIAVVEVLTVYANGDVDGTFIEMAEPDTTLPDNVCLHNLLAEFADGVYEQQDEDGDGDDTDDEDDYASQAKGEIERSELHELMNIIDRQSTLAAKRSQAFNLLALARILALSLDETRKAEEYHDRMTFIHLMQQYAVNQWIDTDEFELHYRNCKGLLTGNPDMQEQVLRLFCISRIDKDGSIGELAKLAEGRQGTLTADIAGLVMAYNALKAHDMDAERRSIRNKINELLSVETRDVSHLDFMGEEGPQLEFKASLVFPPDNNQRPNREKQCKKLLTVICGMMNSQGGRLLVGVNDLGYADGLAADFKDLAGTGSYDEQKARDLMQNFFVGMLRQHMPPYADLYLHMGFEDHNGRSVFVVDVTPSKEIMNVDGHFYRRVGSTTQDMQEKEREAVEALKKGKN